MLMLIISPAVRLSCDNSPRSNCRSNGTSSTVELNKASCAGRRPLRDTSSRSGALGQHWGPAFNRSKCSWRICRCWQKSKKVIHNSLASKLQVEKTLDLHHFTPSQHHSMFHSVPRTSNHSIPKTSSIRCHHDSKIWNNSMVLELLCTASIPPKLWNSCVSTTSLTSWSTTGKGSTAKSLSTRRRKCTTVTSLVSRALQCQDGCFKTIQRRKHTFKYKMYMHLGKRQLLST